MESLGTLSALLAAGLKTLDTIVYDFLVARTFCSFVTQCFGISRLSLYYTNGRGTKVPLEGLLFTAGEVVLWNN